MKTFVRIFFLLALLTGYSATSSPNFTQSGARGIIGPSGVTPTEFPDYVNGFLYTVKGKCNDKRGLSFYYLATFEDSLRLPDSLDGKKMKAHLSIYLDKNGFYAADYQEMVLREDLGDNPTVYQILSTERVFGKWFIQDRSLHLSDLGKASAITYNQKPALMLEIEDFNEKTVLDRQAIIMEKIISTGGRDSYKSLCETE